MLIASARLQCSVDLYGDVKWALRNKILYLQRRTFDLWLLKTFMYTWNIEHLSNMLVWREILRPWSHTKLRPDSMVENDFVVFCKNTRTWMLFKPSKIELYTVQKRNFMQTFLKKFCKLNFKQSFTKLIWIYSRRHGITVKSLICHCRVPHEIIKRSIQWSLLDIGG